MANSSSGDSVVERVVRILGTFDSTRVTQTSSQIARGAKLPGSTAHRLVGELVEQGLLERDADGEIRIGMRLWELTTRGSHALELRELAMPAMREVQARMRQHTQLGVLDREEVLFLERLSDPRAGANITRIAGRLPLHASSSGLVLLAHSSPDFQARFLARPHRALAPETIVDPVLLRTKLAEVRRTGYAVAPGSVEPVSTGIAVPISDASGVVAALSVVLPRGQEHESATVAELGRAARMIETALRGSRFASHSMG